MATYYGTSGSDVLYGSSLSDSIYGFGGSDSLYGFGGSDYLDGYGGGTEYDDLFGGTGSDTFVLGDSLFGVSYLGLGYATIKDWNASEDYIQVFNGLGQYRLSYEYWEGSSLLDTAIYYNNDLIGVVQDTTNVSISRDFLFV